MNLPKSWHLISLKTYAKINQILSDKAADTSHIDCQILSLLSGKPEFEILALTMKHRQMCLEKISFLNCLDAPDKRPNTTFWLGGKRYKWILDARELSGGQYIDLMNFLKDPDATVQQIHKILAVLALPMKWGIKKQKYSGQNHAEMAAQFYENMSVATAFPILVFFCQLFNHLMPAITDYLNQQTLKKNQMVDIMSDLAG